MTSTTLLFQSVAESCEVELPLYPMLEHESDFGGCHLIGEGKDVVEDSVG